ncbi:NEDD4-binding protein 1 [Rhinatrema bivittatum]|uniref:NEDD4-binding protein 1 n=1 Tax=Rhinatrema bivittatum TaxID=194408 RepID=UPI00112B9A95|nr:NEDD4-binding protein 1 [Rhinatrema bivittatum]
MSGAAGGSWAAGNGAAVEDEFTAPADRRKYLESSKRQIEALFQVVFTVLGVLDTFSVGEGSGQGSEWIWLKLKGAKEAVRKAKEYVKGLCEPELEKKEHYPRDMHCIFVGAQNLFLNGLIQATCADVYVLEIGVLGIKGDIAAVVMAQSHIQQFVKLFENNESLPSRKESEVKKKFKYFVERHADKYTMDLLILPSALKEELLNLTQDYRCLETEEAIGLQSSKALNLMHKQDKTGSDVEDRTSMEETRSQAGTPVTELTKQMDTVFSESPKPLFIPVNGVTPFQAPMFSKDRSSCKRRFSDAEERYVKKQFSLENVQGSRAMNTKSTASADDIIDLSVSINENDSVIILCDEEDVSEEMEYKILVDFFRTMGYSQEIVVQVIREMGQSEEPLKLLEEIEKEHKKLQEKKSGKVCNVQLNNCAKKSTLQARKEAATGASGKRSESRRALGQPVKENKNKSQRQVADSQCTPTRAEESAASCISVAASKDCKNNARLKCSKPGHKSIITDDLETDGGVLSDCTVQELVLDKGSLKDSDFLARGSSDPPVHKPVLTEMLIPQQKSSEPSAPQNSSPVCRTQVGPSHPPQPVACNTKSVQKPPPVPAPGFAVNSGKLPNNHIDVSVTGVQRFLHLLKMPYRLELKNEPGRTDLKHIIVDGSNVAMSHGLNKFFSCRGIAIAVTYFWKNGHRNITVFVPQWRTKRDPSITEQHFLTELQDLGILSFTPARTVLGTRIASHDDRFLLHLAEKTGGIIVTNDNFKEFVIESPIWREIIKERLLQYTFAGDIFMIPDDPLGRYGPRLEDFLCKQSQIRNFPPSNFHQMGEKFNLGGPLSHLPALKPTNLGFHPGVRPPPPGGIPPHWAPNIPPGLTIPPQRSVLETSQLKEELQRIFPDTQQKQKINQILAAHPYMRDLNALSAMVLD